MLNYRETLRSVRARVQFYRPDVPPTYIDIWVNDRLRRALSARLIWSDLLRTVYVWVPPSESGGTLTLSYGSRLGVLSGHYAPIDDYYRGQLEEAVPSPGYHRVKLSPMPPDVVGKWLMIGGEVCPVLEQNGARVYAKFPGPFNAGTEVTVSSWSGRQLKVDELHGYITIAGVDSSGRLVLEKAWPLRTTQTTNYRIVLAYITMPPDFYHLVNARLLDLSVPVDTGMSLEELDRLDPQRLTVSFPKAMVECPIDETGIMRYELWPTGEDSKLAYNYVATWPMLTADNDPMPPFIEASVIADGAIADALMYKRGSEDPYYNPQLSRIFEAKYLEGIERLKAADEAKSVKDFTTEAFKLAPPGGDYLRRTIPEEP